jgi:mRNA interferase MazF
MVKRYVPARGDLVWLDFDPALGHEQQGRRPALVLSPIDYNIKTKMMLACPITSRRRGYGFEVAVGHEGISGVVLANQLKSLDWSVRRAEFIAEAEEGIVLEVLARIAPLLNC